MVTLNKILCFVAAFFSTGIAAILLTVFYESMMLYSAIVFRISAFGGVVLIISAIAYVSVNVFLSIEHRAIENNRFKQYNVNVLSRDNEIEGQADNEDIDNKIIRLHKAGESLNSIALNVYGKKGGFYNNQIRTVLSSYDIEI